jgi:hypothetical protein
MTSGKPPWPRTIVLTFLNGIRYVSTIGGRIPITFKLFDLNLRHIKSMVLKGVLLPSGKAWLLQLASGRSAIQATTVHVLVNVTGTCEPYRILHMWFESQGELIMIQGITLK